jgi:hypothetical protein
VASTFMHEAVAMAFQTAGIQPQSVNLALHLVFPILPSHHVCGISWAFQERSLSPPPAKIQPPNSPILALRSELLSPLSGFDRRHLRERKLGLTAIAMELSKKNSR